MCARAACLGCCSAKFGIYRTGKTYTAFQIAYRLWKAGAKKRILFLADRTALLEQAKRGNILSRSTLSLFYATDFADQLENSILPSLKAGFIVLADRYIYTLMARDLVRGTDINWLKNLYGMALVPDAVFYLSVSPETLVQRNFAKDFALDYWESGMDLGLSRDMFDSFLKYQALMAKQFQKLQSTYGFNIIDGERSSDEINAELQQRIEAVLATRMA